MKALRALALRWSGRRLPVLSDAAWERWTAGAAELARDRSGHRTLRTADGAHAVKELGLRRVLSSAILHPYAERFAENAGELLRRGIDAPEVVGAWRRAGPEPIHVVVYRWREGRELRELSAAPDAGILFAELGRLLARLHEARADFRSGHLGNFLVQPGGTVAVIDCVDVRFRPWPLSAAERAGAALRILRRDASDASALLRHALPFLEGYFTTAQLGAAERAAAWSALPPELVGASKLSEAPV